MITRGLSCDCVIFGHFGGGGSDDPPTPPGYGPVMAAVTLVEGVQGCHSSVSQRAKKG